MRSVLQFAAQFRRYALLIPLALTTAGTPVMLACSEGGMSAPNPDTGQGVATGTPRVCCRVCRTGKPCGDACIARTSTCRTSGGCACAG